MQKEISPKILALTFGVLVISFLAIFYVVAWTEPTQAPPGGNVATPLNTGSTGQSKTGGLILNTGGAEYGLIVSGFFKIPADFSNPNSSSLWIDADPPRSFLNQNAYYSPSSRNWQRFSGSYGSLGLWLDSNNGFVLNYASSTAGGSGDNSPVTWTEIMKVGTDGKFLLNSGGVFCPLWKDCDGDGKTGGAGDCNEGSNASYVGNTGCYRSADSLDNDCDETTDETENDDKGSLVCSYYYQGEKLEFPALGPYGGACNQANDDQLCSNTCVVAGFSWGKTEICWAERGTYGEACSAYGQNFWSQVSDNQGNHALRCKCYNTCVR